MRREAACRRTVVHSVKIVDGNPDAVSSRFHLTAMVDSHLFECQALFQYG